MKITEFVSATLSGSPHEEHWSPGFELQFETTNWKARLPKHGSTSPIDNDGPLRCEVGEIVRFGTSGWDYLNQRSVIVIFDFDSADGHKAGLTADALNEAEIAARTLDYVQVHRSKGGKGLHFFVRLEGIVRAATRGDHRLVAIAVLERMKADTGYDFASAADCKGVIGWLWATDAAPNGFELLKPASRNLLLPADWREIAMAVKRTRRSERIDDLPVPSVELDDRHKAYIDWLLANGWAAILDTHDGQPLLRTHTAGLAAMHDALGLPGIYRTLSAGANPQDPNAFAFFRENGGLSVRRYGTGTQEAETWRQDASGWTCCEFGVPATAADAAEALDAVEDPTGGYIFGPDAAELAVQMMGGKFEYPSDLEPRDVRLKPHRDGERLVAEMPALKSDPTSVAGWIKKGRKWTRVVSAQLPAQSSTPAFERLIRHVVAPGGGHIGWVMCYDGDWEEQKKDNCRSVLMSFGLRRSDAEEVLGGSVLDRWKLVDRPFEPEYPGGKEWNRFGAQLAFEPTTEERPMHHPHFDTVLEHCGAGLTAAVRQDPWCRKHGLNTGADYLRLYMASVFQQPHQLLPFLFLFGSQNGGKSSFHELFEILMTKGYRKVDKAFTRETTFNSELSGTLVAVIEEADLTKNAVKAYNTIKDITTSRTITIERKGWDAYDTSNMVHCIQCNNKHFTCPILEEDDSRVVVIHVPDLPPERRIAKPLLEQRWREEAPDFLRTLLDLKLPERSESDDRLYLPVLATPAKWKVIESVAKIMKLDASRRPAAILAQQIEEPLRAIAACGWIIRASATQILAQLEWLGVDDLPDTPEEIGQAIRLLDMDGLIFEEGRINSGRWMTIITPQAIEWREWFDSIEADEDPQDLSDEERVFELLEHAGTKVTAM